MLGREAVEIDERNGETAGELRDEDGTLVATATARLRIVPRRD